VNRHQVCEAKTLVEVGVAIVDRNSQKVHVENEIETRHPEEEEVGENSPNLIFLVYQSVIQVQGKWRDDVEVAADSGNDRQREVASGDDGNLPVPSLERHYGTVLQSKTVTLSSTNICT